VPLCLGIGWRPELALAIERRADLGFVELLAENVDPARPLPAPLRRLRERGVAIGLDRYGASAPWKTIYKELGFTPENIVKTVQSLLAAGK